MRRADLAERHRAVEDGAVFLLQESMEDPISPNPGTDVLARALGVSMVGPHLVPITELEAADEVQGRSGMTQYRVPANDPYDRHGFAARQTPAGEAALEQIFTFVNGVWEGAPLIELPLGCSEVTEAGDCDFTGVWEED